MQLLLEQYLPELERVKVAARLREEEGNLPQHSRPEDTVQLVTSNLPGLNNWGERSESNASLKMPTSR